MVKSATTTSALNVLSRPSTSFCMILSLSVSRRKLQCPRQGLESCVQTEDVTDLEGGAVVHHEVATDNYVYVVWRRRRKHNFQLARARLHLLLKARRQSSVHDQLAL